MSVAHRVLEKDSDFNKPFFVYLIMKGVTLTLTVIGAIIVLLSSFKTTSISLPITDQQSVYALCLSFVFMILSLYLELWSNEESNAKYVPMATAIILIFLSLFSVSRFDFISSWFVSVIALLFLVSLIGIVIEHRRKHPKQSKKENKE